MACTWDKVTLGRTGVRVSPIGLGSSFGIGANDVERAFERGLNYMYWGSLRRDGFGKGVRAIARKDREHLVTVVQSYTRVAGLMRRSLEKGLRELGLEYTDFLLLGWWNQPPPARILDAARALVDAGKARHIMISCHQRTTFPRFIEDPTYGAIMVRYNASHPGAEEEVFPALAQQGDRRPGVVAYTATRWGHLIDPKLTPQGEQTPRASDCYRFALTHRDVNLVLSGPRNGADLDEAMSALDRGPMSPDDLAWMKRVGASVKQQKSSVYNMNPISLVDRVVGLFSK